MSVSERLTEIAQTFAKALVAEDFVAAHGLLTTQTQQTISVEQLQQQYIALTAVGELSIDLDNPFTMADWPAKQPDDLGWAYVVLSGDICSEAIAVIVTKDELIREVEWGRP